VRIVIAIFSYDGGLYFGVTGDYDGAEDVDVLSTGIGAGVEELLAISRRQTLVAVSDDASSGRSDSEGASG
jgi:hypothetical protein